MRQAIVWAGTLRSNSLKPEYVVVRIKEHVDHRTTYEVQDKINEMFQSGYHYHGMTTVISNRLFMYHTLTFRNY